MKRAITTLCALVLMAAPNYSAAQTPQPQIQIRDGMVSMKADSVPLGRLIALLDRATGMTSTVPAEASNQRVSVQFSGLDFDSAVRKIFEGRAIDYMFIEGQGINVTALAGTFSAPTGPASAFGEQSPFMNQPSFINDPFAAQQDNVQPMQVMPSALGGIVNGQPANGGNPFVNDQNNGQQPAVIQTPFGPIPNPRAGEPMDPAANRNGAAAATPAAPANNNGGLFGNTSPPMLNLNANPQQQQPGAQQNRGPAANPLFPPPVRK